MFRILIVMLIVAVGVFVALQPTSHYMDGGGNVAALNDVRHIALVVENGIAERSERAFEFTIVREWERKALQSLGRRGSRKARFLVTKERVTAAEGASPRLVVVCDTPFTNVPARRFWPAPPTHAAGYSDASTRLISTNEFAALKKEQFVPLDELFPWQTAEE